MAAMARTPVLPEAAPLQQQRSAESMRRIVQLIADITGQIKLLALNTRGIRAPRFCAEV